MQPVSASPDLSAQIEGYSLTRSTVGESGCSLYRLSGKQGAADLYLKYGEGPCAQDLIAEHARLAWVQAHLPVPRIIHFETHGDEAWLLMSAMAGASAYQVLEQAPDQALAISDALAMFLRRIHAIPASSCPFNSDRHLRMHSAQLRLEAGLVDEADFDDERQGWTARQVWQCLTDQANFDPETVVTHGDYSLDNLFIENGEVTGCIDLGRMGTADRYQDLAIMWNCLTEFGSAAQERFLQAYGIKRIDRQRLDFHLLLDEMF